MKSGRWVVNVVAFWLMGMVSGGFIVTSVRAQPDLRDPSPAASPASSKASAQDSQFISNAAKGGAQECADARLALMMTRRDDVKQIAEMLFQDHTDAIAALAALVTSKGWTLPASIQPTNGPGANGTFSDAQFLADQVASHKSAIVVFESEVSRGEDVDLRAFAKATLLNLKHHLVMLQVLSDGLNVSP
jgi:putative membrane protein